MATQEQRWATAERELDVHAARRIRRTPSVVIGILGLLVLAVGIISAVDLGRLQTPRGAALAWTEAATFGDCHAFLSLSRTTDPAADGSTDEICRALRASTARARSEANRIRLTAKSVERHARDAVVTVQVTGPDGARTLPLHLVERGDRWLVLRQPGACDDLACA